ncbi:MAG: Ig-like domain-containing protein [Clostridia bacterium]|nr:Ig-like domain-containing protein [Clostridia bacterium]
MKNKKIICFLIAFFMIIVINIQSYAITLPVLKITSNNYSVGDKVNLEEKTTVEVGETLQLYAVTVYGNDLMVPDMPDSLGWFVEESNLSGVTWSSSDTTVATIDDSGKLTGLKDGITTITVNNPSGTEGTTRATKEIEVKKPSVNPDTNNTSNNIITNTDKNTNISNDSTTSKTILPKTGNSIITVVACMIIAIIASYNIYKKYNSYNDIK